MEEPARFGGTIHRLISLLARSLNALGVTNCMKDAEQIGIMVHHVMSADQRSFHTPEHILDLVDPDDPHVTLAAIFHDLVYYQVDRGLPAEFDNLIAPYLVIDPEGITLRDDIDPQDRAFAGCSAVFGFQPGQRLNPFAGLNEFLSALVMDTLFESVLSDRDLLIATACIEATIPFRGRDRDGRTPPQRLHERIAAVVDRFGLAMSPADVAATVKAAVRFANRDVNNFAERDVARFLGNTWALLPESNPELRVPGTYTAFAYATALVKMHGFLSNLDPEAIYQEFDGAPPPLERGDLVARAGYNTSIAARYLGVKLVTATMIYSIADATGGDVPMALFMGEIVEDGDNDTLDHYLPERAVGCARDLAEADPVRRLLEEGRADQTSFDLRSSPLSLFAYRCMDDEMIDGALAKAQAVLKGSESPQGFLSSLAPSLVAATARAAARIAFTRAEELQALAATYAP